MHITERECGVAQGLLTRYREKQLELDEFDANTLHTVVHAFRDRKEVTEDIGELLYRINRKHRESV